jgi:hypothetical protein
VKAALGKTPVKVPGTLAGFIIRQLELDALGKSPAVLAKEIARGVSASSGIRVTSAVVKIPGGGGILVGYRLPAVFK